MFADSHIHLAALDPLAAKAIAESGSEVLSVTCGPSEYMRARDCFAPYANVHVALGFHPWQIGVNLGARELADFCDFAAEERHIGEIGLDFHKDLSASRASQVDAFRQICNVLSQGEHVISLHSRGAARELLDTLECHRLAQRSTCILHGYNGPGDQMARARDMGCCFSFGLRELRTKRGREYARQLPACQLLFETDADGTKPFSYDDWKAALEIAGSLG